jgi:hypothetical protein
VENETGSSLHLIPNAAIKQLLIVREKVVTTQPPVCFKIISYHPTRVLAVIHTRVVSKVWIERVLSVAVRFTLINQIMEVVSFATPALRY